MQDMPKNAPGYDEMEFAMYLRDCELDRIAQEKAAEAAKTSAEH